MIKIPRIPNNADKLTEEASIEVVCQHSLDVHFDMINFFNKNGYHVVSSEDEGAADLAMFVYDKRTNTLHTPFIKPEEVLPLMLDFQKKFEQNNIVYTPFRTKYADQFVEPISDNRANIIPDKDVWEQLRLQNLEKISINLLENLYIENISTNGPKKIYRGTTMGDSPHTTCSQDYREMFVYATPNISKALGYANSPKSRFSFLEEYQAFGGQKYASDHGLESDECFDNIDWKKSKYGQYRNFETYAEKETNPHLCTYLYDSQTKDIYKIYENGKYVDEFWEKYAKSRKPKRKYSNKYIAERIQKIIDLTSKNNRLAEARKRVAKAFDKKCGTNLEKVELPLSVKKVEQKISNIIYGKKYR